MAEENKRFSEDFIAWLNRKIHLANNPNGWQRPTISGLWGDPEIMDPEERKRLKLERFRRSQGREP